MSDLFDSNDFIRKFLAQMKKKRELEFFHKNYAGACYDVLVNYRGIPVVAVNKSPDGIISQVMVVFLQNEKYCEAILQKHELIQAISDNDDYPFCTPNMLGNLTQISVVSSKHVRTDPNNIQTDNLGNLPSIDRWKTSDARKYLKQNIAALSQK